MAPSAIRYRAPAPALRPFITVYYWVDVPPGMDEQRDWLHPEWPNIRFIVDGVWRVQMRTGWETAPPSALFGPTSRTVPAVGASPSRLVGLGLLPLGYATLFDDSAAVFADRVCALDDHLVGVADLHAALAAAMGDDDAQAALLEAYFTARFAERAPASDLLRRAHAVLLDPQTTTVDGFAEALGVSSRHLQRLCRGLFGFPPKLLLRRQRLMRTLDTAAAEMNRPFGEILDAAYFDQSHFVRDFRLFMGFSPSQYFGLNRPLQTIAQRERLKALGASFQDLHAQRVQLAGESGSSKPARSVRA